MAGTKKFTDYAEEFEDCMDVLDGEVPEYTPIDGSTLKPSVSDRKLRGVNTLFMDEETGLDDEFFDVTKHWVGMPAMECKEMAPIKQLVVNFSSEEDYAKFIELMGQTMSMKTKSIWFPERDTIAPSVTRWIDEGEIDGNDE